MKRLALVAPALFSLMLAGTADAQIYQWKDANGRTVISDKPPTGAVSQSRKIDSTSASPTAAPQDTAAKRELDFRKRQKESQDSAEKAEKERAAAEQTQGQCESAKRYLQTLESGERIAARDDKGERYFLDDAQRAQETTKARQAIQASCK